MRVIETKVYMFEELPKEGQDKALDLQRDINANHDWSEPLLDSWKECLEKEGFTAPTIRWSGFGSQGDGASFTSGIDLDKFIAHMPSILRNQYRYDKGLLTGVCGAMGLHQVHEHTGYVNVEWNEVNSYIPLDSHLDRLTESIESIRIALSKELYKELETEYDYLTSNEQVRECLISNEYEFTIDGVLI